MCLVPKGKFFIGCDFDIDTSCGENEEDVAQKNLDAFLIDQHEATVANYSECVKNGKCKVAGINLPFSLGDEFPEDAWACNWDKKGKGSHPINCIPWAYANTYCEWAGKRLPSEAEWVKAARGNVDARKYVWGNTERPTWASLNGKTGTAPVKSHKKDKSLFGIFDLTGNVVEWVSDSIYIDGENFKLFKGGEWETQLKYSRISSYNYSIPTRRDSTFGFRCALSLTQNASAVNELSEYPANEYPKQLSFKVRIQSEFSAQSNNFITITDTLKKTRGRWGGTDMGNDSGDIMHFDIQKKEKAPAEKK